MRALLSVYDKRAWSSWPPGSRDLGWDLVASGNTSAALHEAGIAHVEVAEVTGFARDARGPGQDAAPAPSTAGSWPTGRRARHLADLEAQGIEPIDLVVSNLYPFSLGPVGSS